MKRYLVIFLFIFSFIANSSGLASVLSGFNKVTDSMPVASLEHHDSMSVHCHQMQTSKMLSSSDCDRSLGETCGYCFIHCGGALLSAALPSFGAQPNFWLSVPTHYYTPLLVSSFLRPPQVS